MSFVLHPQLAANCLPVVDWPLCRVLRMNDTTYPWLILVPRRLDCREIIDLPGLDRLTLLAEICRLSEKMQAHCKPDKLNVAALGNMVPQLHIHVIARFTTDPAWPKPVWGHEAAKPFASDSAQSEIRFWQGWLADQGETERPNGLPVANVPK